MRQNGLDFRTEHKHAPVPEIVKRLNAKPVANGRKSSPRSVPNDVREHAAKSIHRIGPILLKGVEDGFCIATRLVTMPGAFKRWPQRSVVKDLAVVYDP